MARFEIADDGIPGLTLALRIRLKGHEVALVPAAHTTLDEHFTLPAPYRDLFLKSGGALEETAELLPASERVFVLDGITIRVPAVGPHSVAIGAALGPDAAAQWAAFTRASADIWGALRTDSYRSTGTLQQLAKSHLRNRSVRELLHRYVASFGLDADRVGDAAAVLPYLEQTFGRWTFAGGSTVVADELRQRCLRLGVEAETNGGEYLDVASFWTSAFTTPPRRWRAAAPAVDTRSLGLPWIGMAAELIADRIGRATRPTSP